MELACEALTLGVFGGMALLVLAQPAFKLTAGDEWLKKTDLAVDLPGPLSASRWGGAASSMTIPWRSTNIPTM